MPLTQQDYTTLVQYRSALLDSMKAVSDEYVLATYNRMVRTLDRCLPEIEVRIGQLDKKTERQAAASAGKESVKQAVASARAARESGQTGSFGGSVPASSTPFSQT